MPITQQHPLHNIHALGSQFGALLRETVPLHFLLLLTPLPFSLSGRESPTGAPEQSSAAQAVTQQPGHGPTGEVAPWPKGHCQNCRISAMGVSDLRQGPGWGAGEGRYP